VISAEVREQLRAVAEYSERDHRVLITPETLAIYLLGPEPTREALALERGISSSKFFY
jgi:hypothetical protein